MPSFLATELSKALSLPYVFLAVLVSLKILKAHTAREFQVVVMMACVVCLCGFLPSQDFAIAFCLFVAFTLLIAALIQFHRGASPGAFWRPLATTFKLLAQAAPLVVLLFLLFPRINTGFLLRISDPRSATTGFSDRLSPAGGSQRLRILPISLFARSFLTSGQRQSVQCIGEGLVMWHCEGMEWRAPYSPGSISDLSRQYPASDKAIRQRITIAPHGSRWMFAYPIGPWRALRAQYWRAAIICTAFSRFEKCGAMKRSHPQNH